MEVICEEITYGNDTSLFLLYSPLLSLPVFPVLSSPLQTCHVLSCPPFSFLFPSFPPLHCPPPPLFLFSPLYCPALSFSPLFPCPFPWPMVSLQFSCKGEQIQRLCPHCPGWKHPQTDPVTNSDPRAQTSPVCPPLRQAMSSLSQGMKATGKKETFRLQNQGCSSVCPAASVACSQWKPLFFAIINDSVPTAWGVPAVMGARDKCEHHPSLPSAPARVPITQCEDPSEQLQSQSLLSKAVQCLHFCGEKLSG